MKMGVIYSFEKSIARYWATRNFIAETITPGWPFIRLNAVDISLQFLHIITSKTFDLYSHI
jgi:hypothetical protein